MFTGLPKEIAMKKLHIISGSCYHIEGTKKQTEEVLKSVNKLFNELEEEKQNNFMYGLITVTVATEMGLKIEWR